MGHTVVIGLGNPSRGDEGIGIAILECLRESYAVPEQVVLLDGTATRTLKTLASARRLLLLDAIENGAAPGETVALHGVDVHGYLDRMFAPHHIQVRAALTTADLRRRLPDQLVAIGVEPKPARKGARLSPEALQGIDKAAALAARQLEEWGFACTLKEALAAGAGR